MNKIFTSVKNFPALVCNPLFVLTKKDIEIIYTPSISVIPARNLKPKNASITENIARNINEKMLYFSITLSHLFSIISISLFEYPSDKPFSNQRSNFLLKFKKTPCFFETFFSSALSS